MSVIMWLRGFSYPCKINKIPLSRCFLARHASTQNEAQDIDLVIDDEKNLKENDLDQICDKSRLNKQHRNLINGRVPYDTSMHRFHNTVKYKRRMYGRYGDISNVYPGLAWPTAAELENIREYEQVAYPLTIQELQHNALKRLEAEKNDILMRQKKIDDNMKNLNGWLKEVKEKAEKKIFEAQQAKEKREKLIEEVKKHFGYKIDPKDERFKEMLVKREKEEKKKIRDEKKKIREEKLLQYLKTNE